MSSINIFKVGDCDWWATTFTAAEFLAWYQANVDDQPEVEVSPALTDVQLDAHKMVEHEFGPDPLTYRQILERMLAKGTSFNPPELFATTEW